MLCESIICGEKAELSEAMSLAAMAEALYVSVTLESRQLGNVQACFELWTEAARLFSELCDQWTDVQTDDPSIVWLRGRLRRFYELAQDRVSLYSINEAERWKYQARKDTELETAFGDRLNLTVEETQHYSA